MIAQRTVTGLFLLVAALVCAAYLAGASISDSWILALLVSMVIITGLPHGALDPLVAERHGIWHADNNLLAFIGIYTAIALAVVVTWWLLPAISLTLFLLISAWHFGKDWQQHFDTLPVGCLVIGWPAVFHGDAVTEIFSMLAPATEAALITDVMAVIAIGALAVVLTRLLVKRPDAASTAEITGILISASLLPPLLYFCLYFCLLHSPRHLVSLSKEFGLARSLKTALIFTVLTLLLLLPGAWLIPASSLDERIIALLFIGLAALTVPHMLLLERSQQH